MDTKAKEYVRRLLAISYNYRRGEPDYITELERVLSDIEKDSVNEVR